MGVIFDLRDVPVTSPETDRSRGRSTVVIVVVLVVVLGVLITAGISGASGRLERSATRIRGERVLTAIVLPQAWQRQPVVLTGGTGNNRTDSSTGENTDEGWTQRVHTDVTDPSIADGAVRTAITAAGWEPTKDCWSATPATISCEWRSGAYVLQSDTIEVTGAQCPAGRQPCIKVDLTLRPAVLPSVPVSPAAAAGPAAAGPERT